MSSPSDRDRKRSSTRRLRDRKERKHYTDDWALGDEEIEGSRLFQLEDKLESDRYAQNFVKEMSGKDFNITYLQKHGFSTPILFAEKSGLGLQVPSSNFTINDVRTCVGSRRMLDVMDVNTQKNCEMTMKEWQKYYEDPDKDKLLNVISLEFSHTRLENYIKTPSVVRQVDWVDCVWPRHLKEQQRESTNAIDEMMYPKVQKYCLMSVKGCYTDFHVDFGGTSVWYHILKGSKVFWLIPPTERNLTLYEQWVLSGKQSDVFFGDMVDKCGRVRLHEGNTFFIPSGWIHAVYTPKDSLVFGGNFLHAFGIEKQLRIAQVEDTTHVPQKFRYPFFTEMLWYVLERYVHCLLGRSHLEINDKDDSDPPDMMPDRHVHLTSQELHGLKAIVMYLHSLPTNKKNVPELLSDPIALIRDVRTLVERHRNDSPEQAVTGIPILRHSEESHHHQSHHHHRHVEPKYPRVKEEKAPRKYKGGPRSSGEGPRRRRTRCKKCEACMRSDCGECPFCQDMVKFGGLGRAKQTCVMRQCLQPMLPVTAACADCGLDGWLQRPVIPVQNKNHRQVPSSLMECSVCYEIVHPECVFLKFPDVENEGVVNEDLPNSWECPKCCREGKNVEYRPRHFRARQKSSDIRRMSCSSDASSMHDTKDGIKMERMDDSDSGDEFVHPSAPSEAKRAKLEAGDPNESENVSPSESKLWDNGKLKKEALSPPGSSVADREPHQSAGTHSGTHSGPPSPPNNGGPLIADPRKVALRTQLAYQIANNSSKSLKRPMFVVRPAPGPRSPACNKDLASGRPVNYALEKNAMLPVMEHLTTEEKVKCALVCKAWAGFSVDPSLWRRMSVAARTLTANHLSAIARRQPEALILDWTNVGKRQLGWLIIRLPQLRELSLQGINIASVLSLRTCMCPPLSSLDLSFVTGLNDASIRDILSPPPDSRPGLVDTKSRLRNLRTLKLAGSSITDVALRYITQHLPRLTTLDLSSCTRLTDAGIAQLTTPPAGSVDLLQSLNLSNCSRITDTSLEHLSRCVALSRLDMRHSPHVSAQAVGKFVNKSKLNLRILDGKLVLRATL